MWPEGRNRVLDVCRHYPNGVPADEHHFQACDAKVLLVGEAPGGNENLAGLPFVGASGHLLESRLLAPVGLSRADCYITNVLSYQPPANTIALAKRANLALVQGCIARVETVVSNSRMLVVVPLGNTALHATTNLSGITKWRGSVLIPRKGRFVVPTFHPAAILRQPILIKTALYDWKRISSIIKTGRFDIPTVKLLPVAWNDPRLAALERSKILACDIETVRGSNRILCVAFCGNLDPFTAYSVDCRYGVPSTVRTLLESNIPKVFQNGSFDCYVLAQHDIHVKRFIWDTSLMFHALDNNVGPTTASSEGGSTLKPYSLAYMASVFTPFPYWKDSGKDAGEGESSSRIGWKAFQQYNAMDALGTLALAKVLHARLLKEGRMRFYKTHYADLIDALGALALHGIRFDVEAAKRYVGTCSESLQVLKKRIATLAGRPLHKRKVFVHEPKVKENRRDNLIVRCEDGVWVGESNSLSPTALQRYLYDVVKVKRVTHDGHATVDEVALRKTLAWVTESATWKGNKEVVTNVIQSVLEFRELEKTMQFLSTGVADADGRVRASYSFLTQTGRLKSARNPTGTGINLQNVQRNIRHFFLPDETFFVEIDLKQAEDLVVKAMAAAVTKDDRPLQLVHAVQEGKRDIHKELAAKVFDVPPKEVTYEQRYCAKRCRHARNNGMQEKRMQETLIKDGFSYTTAKCKRILDAVDAAEPWVGAFHRAVRDALMRDNQIVTSWDWRLNVAGERFTDPSLFRRGYAFIQQSEIGVLLKQYGLRTYWEKVHPIYKARLNMLVHDNLVLSVPHDELYDVIHVLVDALQQPRTYKVRRFVGDDEGAVEIYIPAEVKLDVHLPCACATCKKNPPLEVKMSWDKKQLTEEVTKWKNKRQ